MKSLLFVACCFWLGTLHAQYTLVVYPQQNVLTTGMEWSLSEAKIDSVVFALPLNSVQKIEKVTVLVLKSNGEVLQTFTTRGAVLSNRLLAELQKNVNGKLLIPQYETSDGHKHSCKFTLLLKP
jgi:hypothetical protein